MIVCYCIISITSEVSKDSFDINTMYIYIYMYVSNMYFSTASTPIKNLVPSDYQYSYLLTELSVLLVISTVIRIKNVSGITQNTTSAVGPPR